LKFKNLIIKDGELDDRSGQSSRQSQKVSQGKQNNPGADMLPNEYQFKIL